MVVLSLDTTTRVGSCALVRDGATVREESGNAFASHGQQLPARLMALLAHAGLVLADVDAFAVASGPGSFTGLRVGIATMQGLAFASMKPLLGVSTLDALAGVADAPHVITWVDAWRGEVYSAEYDHGRSVTEPMVIAPAEVLARLGEGPYVFVGDGADSYRDRILETLRTRARIADPAAPLLAAAIARRATARVRAGECPPPHAIRPVYVRRSDAELTRDAMSRPGRSA
jgi:tRNA threonylcarbamoyladenosine biosynthesis protein TsaB